MNAAATYPSGSPSMPGWLQPGRIGPLGAIVLLHIGLFCALRSGAPHETTAHHEPAREVTAFFINPEPRPAPAPVPAQAAAPKPVPVKPVTRPNTRPKPVPRPETKTSPSPKAITESVAPPVPAVAEPATPAAVAPAMPSAPAASPAPAQPGTITAGIEYIHPPQPDYPPVSRRMGEEGKAILRVLVNLQGRPERIEVQKSSGSPRLDEAARQAVSRATFKPFTEDGKPVAAYAIVPIKFQLDS